MAIASCPLLQDGHGRIILWITFGLMAGSAIGFAILGSTKSWKYRAHAGQYSLEIICML